MESDRTTSDVALFDRLLRRARIVVAHYRYRGQPIDARRVAQRIVADCAQGSEQSLRHRAALEEAVRSLINGLR